ncbi:MAG TPA: heavy-metal-associated domain-containing protein, partial [Sphingomicrobium sp.]|nr:heavy-metal-associated domain-containing protein [Sphingomicrobium sp.]
MLRRRPAILIAALIALAGIGGALVAQMESADRGILPIDSSGTLEISGIDVDVAGKDAESARYAGWRIAQREGFKALWAKTNNRPVSQAPNLSDSVLDGLVSSIVVEREQIGPNRYIATLGVLFDRARAGELLGVAGEVRRSAPMLLIPVMISGGTATSVELKNHWQRAWAYFRTSQSPIDYVRVSGLGVDPLLVNAAQTRRPGRGWWRNILDLYGAA